jgi:hypothetical protein
MQKKLIEAIECFAKKARKKGFYNAKAKVFTLKGEKTLLIDIFGDKPYIRVCIDGKGYATYFFDEVVIEKYWDHDKTAKGFSQITFGKAFQGYHGLPGKSNILPSEETEKVVVEYFKDVLKEEASCNWIDTVDSFEQTISIDRNRKAAERTYQNRMDKVNEYTKDIRPIPAKVKNWALKKVTKHYLRIEPFRGRKETTGVCTYCKTHSGESKIIIPKGNENLKKCPVCGKKVTVVRTDKYLDSYRNSKYFTKKEIILLQKYKEDTIERHFVASYWISSDIECSSVDEKGFKVKNSKTGFTDHYYLKYDRWADKEFWDNKNFSMQDGCIVFNDGALYPDKKVLADTEYKYSGIDYIKGDIDPLGYLARYKRMPQIEMLAKVGLSELAKTIKESDMTQDYKKPWEMLKINKEEFTRLRAMKGNLAVLKWLQFENESGMRCNDNDIKWIVKSVCSEYESCHKPEGYSFVLGKDKMTLTQIRNYLKKQKRLSGYDYVEVYRKWRDYCDMAEVVKRDMSLEMNYKPKNVVKAHDELASDASIARRENELLEKFPNVNDICSTLKKYEYTDGIYSIVAPESVRDIIKEGQVLQHCLDSSNIYFDRIERKETYIVFLRKNSDIDTPYYSLEIEPDGTTRQKRTTGDKQDADFRKECLPFIRKWQKAIKTRLSREDKELASTSAVLREEEFAELRKNGNKIRNGVLAGKLLVDVLEEDLMLA